MQQSGRQAKLLKDYSPPDYLIEEVELDVSLEPKAARVASKLRLRPNPKVATGGRPLVLDGEALRLRSLALDGKPLSRRRTMRSARPRSPSPRVPAKPFTLEIVTLCDPDANTALSGLYRSRGTYCTQCEPEGFRRITYFLDRPDVLAVYTVRIEADRASTPGAAVERQSGGARRHRRHRPALRRLARSLPQAVLSLRAGRRRSRLRAATASPPAPAARSRSASMSSTARRIAAPGRWTR